MVEIALPAAAIEALKVSPLCKQAKDMCHKIFIEKTRGIITQYSGPIKFEGYWKKSTRQASMEQVSRGALKLHGRAWHDYPGD